MEKILDDLVKVSQKFGKNPEYILAGGGNTSYKNGDKIWVKASGTSMADIDINGFVCLDRAKLKKLSTRTYSENSSQREQEVKEDLAAAILYPEGKRPSVETSMHEVIDYPFVVHTHPTLMNGLLCAEESEKIIKTIFGDVVVYVPYTDPGYVLFKAVNQALKNYRREKGFEPLVIFLENHGVFVGGNSVQEIEDVYNSLEEKINARLDKQLLSCDNKPNTKLDIAVKVIREIDAFKTYSVIGDNSDITMHFVNGKETFKSVQSPFTPDNIVYCKSQYVFVEDVDELESSVVQFKQRTGYYPKLIAVQGVGIFAVEESEKSAQIVLDVFKDMMKVAFYTESFGGPRPMTQQQIDFIDNWEVENYRRQISKGK